MPRVLLIVLASAVLIWNTPAGNAAKPASPVANHFAGVVIPDPQVGPHAMEEALHQASAPELASATSPILPLQMTARFGARAGTIGPVAAIALGTPPTPFHREVFGFAPYWSLSTNGTWDYRLLTTLAYFGLTINGAGNFETTAPGYSQWNSQAMVDMVNRAHAAGDRVVVVVKQFYTDSINRIVTDPALTDVAISNIMAAIASKNLDGVNIDFEGKLSAPYIYLQSGITTFMSKLSQAVHARWPTAEVSIDTYTGSASWDGGIFKIGDLAPVVDAMFVMAYDMAFGNQPGVAAANAPLTYFTYNDTLSVSQYLSKAPASKVILGVPYYGYKWSTTGNGPNAARNPLQMGATADTYANIMSEIACHPLYLSQGWDSYAQSPWMAWYSPATNDPCDGNHGSWRELYYDNAQSLGLKYDLVNQSNLRGAGMWALGYDGGAPELWTVIAQKLTTVTVWDTQGGSTTSDSGVASWGTSRLDLVVRNGGNGLSHNAWDGTQWLGWESLGGSLSSAPDAVSGTANRVDVFVRGFDTAIWHKSFIGGAWQGWESLGGNVATAPAAASWGATRLDVFVVGVDRAMYHRWWDGTSWHNWESLGGSVSSDPAAVSWGPNRLDVFVRGTDNRLYHKGWDPTGWKPWDSLGGDLISNPAAASCGAGKLDVFAVGRDRALWRRGWNGTSWGPWQPQGGQWAGGPSAVCRPGMTVIEVFERGQDLAAWHTTVTSS